MKKRTTKDKDLVTVGKSLEYMVQAIKGSLNETQQSEFFKCTNNLEIFKFLWSLDITHEVLSLEEEYEHKSDDLSKSHREKGNEYFKKQSYLTALKEYNSSVFSATYEIEKSSADEKEGPEIALAFGNRSAALFQLGKYPECIGDIDSALNLNYPKSSIHKLNHRKGSSYLKMNSPGKAEENFKLASENLEDAKSLIDEKMYNAWKKTLDKSITQCSLECNIETETNGNNNIETETNGNNKVETETKILPKLSTQSHELHSEASKSLEFKSEKSSNCFVVSTDNVSIGDVVAIEEPLISCLFEDRIKQQRCYNCLSRIPVAPYPCLTCSSVVFCDRKCRDDSLNSYHRRECHYFALLGENMCSDVGHLALRMVMKLGVPAILETFNKDKSESKMIKDTNEMPNNSTDERTNSTKVKCVKRELFKRLYDLEIPGFKKSQTNSANDIPKMIEIPLLSCFLAKLLCAINYVSLKKTKDDDENNKTTDNLISPDDFYHVGAALITNIQLIKRYAKLIRLTSKFGDEEDSLSQSIGIALYPNVISQFKHSCDPSADVVFYNDVAVVRAIREIFPGDEVSVSFGPLFHEVKLEKRRYGLWNDYYVACNCIACFNKWPILEEMFQDIPGYRCEKCRTPLTTADKIDTKYLWCPNCQHKQNLEEIVFQLQNSFDSYATAINDAMSGNRGDALEPLKKHLQLLGRYLRQPWPDLVACQVAVKMCYRLEAHEY